MCRQSQDYERYTVKQVKRIKSILKISEQGVSRPYLCVDESDGIRWCKGCHTGVRSVVSEWICARLAARLGLPVPDFAILKLDVSTFREWRKLQNLEVPEIVTDSNPYVFGSLNVEDSKDVFDAESELDHVDKKVLAKILTFDRFIHNTDRTDCNSNLLVNGNVYIIDHNNAFDPKFSISEFEAEHILRGYRDVLSEAEESAFSSVFAELVNGTFLDEVWSEMPDAWTNVAEDILPLSHVRDVLQEECNVGVS